MMKASTPCPTFVAIFLILARFSLLSRAHKTIAKLGVDIPVVECNEASCEGPLAPLFCEGPVLATVWHFGLYRSCMDRYRRLNYSPQEILANFSKIVSKDDQSITLRDLEAFCDDSFSPSNDALLVPANLSDWTRVSPKSFAAINNAELRKFADRLHSIWPELARQFSPAIINEPERYRIAPVRRPFIVPGGKFKYYFYWDSFWMIRGLYASRMLTTARGMLENFADILRRKGYIPNSAVLEHSRRSQQPYFVPMIADYFEQTGDRQFLEEFLPLAELEFVWWQKNRSIEVIAPDGKRTFSMFQFKSAANCPRVENFGEDFKFGMSLGSLERARFFWSSSAGVCESGWDFTSRFYSDYGTNETLSKAMTDILNVVPVDLNALMAINFQTVSDLYGKVLGKNKKSAEYGAKAAALREAVHELMYDREGDSGVWFDWDLKKCAQRKRRFYPSNIFPLTLLHRLFPNAEQRRRQCERVVAYLDREGILKLSGGVPASMEKRSGQQWDYPNEWAPLTHLVITSLMNCHGDNDEAVAAAKHIADGYLRTSYRGFFHPPRNQPPQMWEKYDVRFDDGTEGFGGEYPVQSGFGWSNGVALELIQMFYTKEYLKDKGIRGLIPVAAQNYPH